MIIRFKDRVFEWWLASTTFGFGIFLSLDVESMDSNAFEMLTRWMSEPAWGVFFVVTGVFHLTALGINGRAWWTPLVRSGTVAFNLAVYIFFGLGFYLVDAFSTGVYSYIATIGSAAAICFYRATKDAVIAMEERSRAFSH